MKTLIAFIFLMIFSPTTPNLIASQNKPHFLESDSTKSVRDSISHNSRFFIDKNGDGYNDNAPDHDNDGIPNGLDPDYMGKKFRWGAKFKNDSTAQFRRGYGRQHRDARINQIDSTKVDSSNSNKKKTSK